LKGPQGTLFGRNTTGGAILLVPKKPTDRLEGYVEGSYGRYSQRRFQAVLNAPLSDTFKIRAGVDWNKRDGYLKNNSGIGPKAYRDVNYVAARLSVLADLTPDLENYTVFSYSDSDTKGDAPKLQFCDRAAAAAFPGTAAFLDSVGQGFLIGISSWRYLGCAQLDRQAARGDGFWGVETNIENPRQKIEQWQVINTTTWQASDNLTIKNIASYSEYREIANFTLWSDNFITPPGAPFAGVWLPPVGAPALFKGITLFKGNKGPTTAQWTFTEELQFQGEAAAGRLKWQAGFYIEISKPLSFNSHLVDIFATCSDVYTPVCTYPFAAFGAGQISDDSTKDYFNDKGIYAQATYDITDRLSMTGGFRYTWDKQRDLAQRLSIIQVAPGVLASVCQPSVDPATGALTPTVFPTTPSDCDVTRRIKSSRPTWTIDLAYKPTDDIMIYVKWSRGYRMGSITSNSIGYETVGPEKVDTYEIGAKTSFRGAVPGYLNITGFYNDFRNQQLTVNTVVSQAFLSRIPPAAPNINAGKSRMWGVEVDGSIRPFEGFKLDAAYTYLNTKLLEFTPPPLPAFYDSLISAVIVGGPLPLSPKHRVNVSANYTLPLDEGIGRITFGVTYVHTSSSVGSTPEASPAYLLRGYDLVNLNASWEDMFGQPIDLSFFMTNTTNVKRILYPMQAFGNLGVDGGHVNEPRMWGFRLKWRFGE
ncbi:MAG: TonB-dependent receptor, partial [Novosphingobium sp.]|nr:TonB-dependent receptor [Novosphingobium sp.]